MIHKKYKIGIDEAGRWPWFGPVVAVALAFSLENPPEKKIIGELNDSKKLTAKKREKLFQKLIEFSLWNNPSVFFWIWEVDNYLIDEINIKKATREAMRRAIVDIKRKINGWAIESVLIDGNDKFTFCELEKPPIYIVEWDSKVSEISAASIIAKVWRDKLLDTYALLYPNLKLESHKGYGTKAHQLALSQTSDVTSFHRISYKPVKAILEQKPKLLLHVCCGPDATIPLVDLQHDFDIVCFWYDPNIEPKSEYNKRLKAFKKVCEIEEIPFIEGEYDVGNFHKKIKWLEHTPEKWEKCIQCYDMRLEKTAELAREMGINYWTTTLTISPHKDVEAIFILWEKYSLAWKVEFLKIAFRKNNGFQRSVEYTEKYGIYRQNYCGCGYSKMKKVKREK